MPVVTNPWETWPMLISEERTLSSRPFLFCVSCAHTHCARRALQPFLINLSLKALAKTTRHQRESVLSKLNYALMDIKMYGEGITIEKHSPRLCLSFINNKETLCAFFFFFNLLWIRACALCSRAEFSSPPLKMFSPIREEQL